MITLATFRIKNLTIEAFARASGLFYSAHNAERGRRSVRSQNDGFGEIDGIENRLQRSAFFINARDEREASTDD